MQPIPGSSTIEIVRYLIGNECIGEYLVTGDPLFDSPPNSGAAFTGGAVAIVMLLFGSIQQIIAL